MTNRKRTNLEDLLDDYFVMRENEWRASLENVISRLYLEGALTSDALSPRDRVALALRFFCQLDQNEIAQLLHITQQAVSERMDKCLIGLMGALIGTYNPRSQKVWKKDYTYMHPAFDKWVIDVLYNIGQWWLVPHSVRKFIQFHFGLKGGAVERDDYDRPRKGRGYRLTKMRNGQDDSMVEKCAKTMDDWFWETV